MFWLDILNEYLPLQQGLRHKELAIDVNTTLLNEYLPLQQGLRRSVSMRFNNVLRPQ